MSGKTYRWTPSAIRALRTGLDLTQVQFAHLIGASSGGPTVSLWESGHRQPSPRLANNMAKLLGLLPPSERPAVVAGTYTLAHMHEDRPQTHLILCEESPTYRAIALAEGAYVPPHLLT